jgi:hypothetical protein
MSLIESLLQNTQMVDQIAGRFGIDPAKANSIMQMVGPSLAGGLHQQLTTDSPSGDAVKAMVADGTHQDLVENPSAIADHDANPALVQHLLGSDQAEALIDKVAASTGVSPDMLRQAMPVMAAVVVGLASKHASAAGGLGNLLTSLGGNTTSGSLVDGLMGMFEKKTA